MFNLLNKREPEISKCYVTHGTMGHLDRKQPPMKRKPYANILAIPFIYKAELILPKEFYEIIKDDLLTKITTPVYSRVILPLSTLLEREFFNEYVKKGNILMLSEGKRGVDDVFSLRDGILTLFLGKESYERAGLTGKPDGIKGMRGTKPRWIVEINLRLPSMIHGKKGFDRIVHSFKDVLKYPVTWLFTNLQPEVMPPGPLENHFPVVIASSPDVSSTMTVHAPHLQPPTEQYSKQEDDFSEFAVDMYEWLSLVALDCPRIDADDRIDPFLSRYSPPAIDPANLDTTDLVRITWNGFLAPLWVHGIFVETLLVINPRAWFSLAVHGFNESFSTGCKECTILKLPGTSNEYVLWELAQN